jgi:hypothetical protein
MKTKIIIPLAVTIIAVCFLSFKRIEKEGSKIALVNSVFGKADQEGFLVLYGDGSMELKPYNFKASSENYIIGTSKIAVIMNEMCEKGYSYKGMGSHSGYSYGGTIIQYMVFERK